MVYSYAAMQILNGKEDPSLDKEDRLPEEQAEFLQKDNNMKGKYLGACLDSCRWGGRNTVAYYMPIKNMVSFIQNWMDQNKDNFQDLWHESKVEDLYSKFELPHIDHEVCPRNGSHERTVRDLSGRIRCAHLDEEFFKPNYIKYSEHHDNLANIKKREYYDPFLELDGGLISEKEHKRYKKEEKDFIINNICYAIISDKDLILPLEKLLNNVNLSSEYFGNAKNRIITPFDGWNLAFYVQRWYEQLPDDKDPF